LYHLDSLKRLRWLYLDGTRVSDAGLCHLQKLTHLTSLGLNDTQLSGGAAQALKRALPRTRVIHRDRDRAAAVPEA
jgi:hypothetical protein